MLAAHEQTRKKKSVKLETKKKYRVVNLYFYTFHSLLTWAAKDQWTPPPRKKDKVSNMNVNG